MRRKKIEVDYQAIADQRGFQWISDSLPRNVMQKTSWRCKKGHQWCATFDNVSRGSGCPFCSDKAIKTEADYHALAGKKGYQWIGKSVPKTTRTKTEWLCEHGVEESTCFDYLRTRKSGCRKKHW